MAPTAPSGSRSKSTDTGTDAVAQDSSSRPGNATLGDRTQAQDLPAGQPIGRIEPRLCVCIPFSRRPALTSSLSHSSRSLTFTCTVPDCGTRSSHEFARKSYQRGIVLVQCPGCKNRWVHGMRVGGRRAQLMGPGMRADRHLIADHLGWFKVGAGGGGGGQAYMADIGYCPASSLSVTMIPVLRRFTCCAWLLSGNPAWRPCHRPGRCFTWYPCNALAHCPLHLAPLARLSLPPLRIQESTEDGTLKTVEDLLRAKGEQVRRGVAVGRTSSGVGAGAGAAQSAVDAKEGRGNALPTEEVRLIEGDIEYVPDEESR